jgi:phosphodiesterase/alkaline phosphatase D-like protein
MSRFSSFVLAAAVVGVLAIPALAGGSNGAPPPPVQFTHGVASGDVTEHRAILWTRVDRAAWVTVEVWRNDRCLTGRRAFWWLARSRAAKDFTIKVDAFLLRPGTEYCYRFKQLGGTAVSPVGRFETAPDESKPASTELTWTGDSDGTKKADGTPAFNNFEVLDRAREEASDFYVYNGDTIYSDSGFRPGPATTLDEYRSLYKENRGYPALTNLLGSTSTYALWDDHEVHNDFDGQTVDPARYAAGRQAFLEYMPIRPSRQLRDPSCAGNPMYGEFEWGSDVDIYILDERSCRSADVEDVCNGDLAPTAPTSIRTQGIFSLFLSPTPPAGCLDAVNDPSRTMLGSVQKAKFKEELKDSDAKWKFVISELGIQQFFADIYDRWEGYGAERKEILEFIRDNGIENVIFLTTDNHANLVNQVFIDRFENCPNPPGPTMTCADTNPPTTIANEFITGPIATNTLDKEIRAAFPTLGSIAVFAFNSVLDIAGLDCRNIDTYSYGVVSEDAAAGTVNIDLKDDAGNPVVNMGPSGLPCSKAFGP